MSSPQTVYRGQRLVGPGGTVIGTRVTADGRELTLPPSLRFVRNASFEWGYQGSGPAQLALALVFDVTRDREFASRCFEWVMVAMSNDHRWRGDRWQVTGAEVLALVGQWERETAQADPPFVNELEGGGP